MGTGGRASILVIAGLPIAVIGGRLYLSTGPGRCGLLAPGRCGLFTATQLLGGAIALAGIALVFAALVLARRFAAGAVAAPGELRNPRRARRPGLHVQDACPLR